MTQSAMPSVGISSYGLRIADEPLAVIDNI